MKPHRQIRTSKRVSSETGTAIDAMIGEPGPTRYQDKLQALREILQTSPPEERRRRLLAELAKEELIT